MKILIVDDEALALARLKRMLNTLGYEDVTEADNAVSALEAIKENHFDLALLDINMPGSNGLELGYELRYHQEDIAIIFQTAYDEHALKAFDIGAVGYLVKPFSIEQLEQCIARVKAESKSSHGLRLMSKAGESYYLLKPEEIYYVKADLSEVMLRSSKGFSYYAQKISDLEKRLLVYDFVRIHRSYLININKIKEIETIEQSKLRFSFQDISDQIESSKDGAKAFRNQFSV
ncbi:LytTR family DNA-binding domain-containing protein [Sulfurovum sp. TSL1]|uniref:LytR/AlgR family response regulator transcription factor n=1 Tax=Sulfurovum sp. TSL1 TaxID=2826994 RepID=UPI001CC50633|nr:LytTR family DNA-binding domain-containing protein [Sulfurovum sp. TSL1]GIT97507.1 DNA-binding response regulator [Sulfurovum sp. TSL1]